MSFPERHIFYFGPGAPTDIATPWQSTGEIRFNADFGPRAGEAPQARASAAATDTSVFTIKLALAAESNIWVVVGSVTYEAGETVGRIASIGRFAVAVEAGDTLIISEPIDTDATLAGVTITLVGARG